MKDLSKKKFDQLSKELEAAQDELQHLPGTLAEKARAEILPYFKKHSLDFVSGVGWGWHISKPSSDLVQDEDLPQYIRALINFEVAYNSPLGLHIRPIKRGE